MSSKEIKITGLYKTPDKGRGKWSEAEDNAIRDYWPKIARLEGRARDAIKQRARIIGLRLTEEEATKRQRKHFADRAKYAARHERLVIQKRTLRKQQDKGVSAPAFYEKQHGQITTFTAAQDKKILELWPQFPAIPNRSKEQIEKRYKALKAYQRALANSPEKSDS